MLSMCESCWGVVGLLLQESEARERWEVGKDGVGECGGMTGGG